MFLGKRQDFSIFFFVNRLLSFVILQYLFSILAELILCPPASVGAILSKNNWGTNLLAFLSLHYQLPELGTRNESSAYLLPSEVNG